MRQLRYLSELETIGDIIDKNICELVQKKIKLAARDVVNDDLTLVEFSYDYHIDGSALRITGRREGAELHAGMLLRRPAEVNSAFVATWEPAEPRRLRKGTARSTYGHRP